MTYTVFAFSNDIAKTLQSKTVTNDIEVAEFAANLYFNKGFFVSHKRGDAL